MEHVTNEEFEIIVTQTAPHAYMDRRPRIDRSVGRNRSLKICPFLAVVVHVHAVGPSDASLRQGRGGRRACEVELRRSPALEGSFFTGVSAAS
jgi:hypothetical protein